MGPARMVRAMRGRRVRVRNSASVVAVGALAVGIVSIPAVPAHAADTITAADQAYFSYYGLDRARAKGYTGEGVTIAMIDGPVDISVPELKGAKITAKETCTITSSNGSRKHGTGVASILVSDVYGVAPGSSLLTYTIAFGNQGDQASEDCFGGDGYVGKTEPVWVLNQAMNDGAQIINLSASSDDGNDQMKWTVARAMSSGVILVTAAGNNATDEDLTSLSQWSGVIGVTAISTDGTRQDYSSWGEGVVTTSIGGPVLFRNFDTGANDTISGTSVASPIVAGVLALAKQRWPEATSNQLLQLLVKTGLNPDHGWNKYTGFGGIDPGAILNTDPSQFPDENPLAQKQGGSSPTPEEVQQYADGVVDPTDIVNDNSYTYRGLDESKLKDGVNVYPTHLGTSPRYHRK
ncbi:S8 family peptidase [Schaalia odontolytica]|uniref:S8 family peptidase n=1 Tax=Schaalia odontolytica TaxID=1660 RepID=UPI00210BB462|nr:S8/S53 family peptidase [Schaalia odontolytica]MCQ5282124.1 S8/S53 family peptidase [Schaalia odontolytica]